MASDCKDYDFVGSYDNQRVSTINAERSVNVFEYLDANGKRPKAMISTSGLVNSSLDFTPETGGSRATFVFNNAIFQVFGASVFLITGTVGSLIKTLLGTLVTAAGYVGIDANQFQVIFVDSVEGYIWDINATTFVQITDVGFPANPIDVCYLDGIFLVAAGGTNNFFFVLTKPRYGLEWWQCDIYSRCCNRHFNVKYQQCEFPNWRTCNIYNDWNFASPIKHDNDLLCDHDWNSDY
jgi:hypothetical protein